MCAAASVPLLRVNATSHTGTRTVHESYGACRMPEGRGRLRKSRFFGPKDSTARLRAPSTTTRT